MALLGWCYKCGKGVEKDDAQAYEWYRKSAEAGDEWGMGFLGLCYEHGTGVEISIGSSGQSKLDGKRSLINSYYLIPE